MRDGVSQPVAQGQFAFGDRELSRGGLGALAGDEGNCLRNAVARAQAVGQHLEGARCLLLQPAAHSGCSAKPDRQSDTAQHHDKQRGVARDQPNQT